MLRLLYEAPSSLDPEKAGSVYESLPINQIFNGLVALDATMNVVPSLASTWTITRDGLTYEFHLRPGVRFHDGSPLTAEDVVFTIRRLLAPGRPQRNVAASYLDAVEGASDYAAGRRGDLPGVTAEGREIVRIRLERPYLSFLQVLAMDGLKIVPQAVVERIGDEAFGRAPIGTGSFRLASWDSGGLRLAAWEGCFLDPPRLDVVEILSPAAGESDGGVGRFDRGETDVLEVPAKEIGRFSHADGVRLHRYQELNLHYLGFCTAIPPLDDIRVRQAIAHAVDPRVLVDEFPGARREATGILPPGLQGFSPEPKTLAFSRETSRRLLAEAGYPEGRGLPPIELLAASSRMDVIRRAETLSAQAATVGIRMNVRQVSWGELSRRVEAKRAPAFLLGWIADLPDPDSFLRTPFEPGGTANYFDLRDATVASLLDQGGREMNPVLRTKIYRQTERLILQLAPLVPLYHSVGLLAVRSRVGGFDPGPLGLSAVDLSRTWVSPGGGR